MTERTANHGRARLWLVSPRPAPPPAACPRQVRGPLALQGQVGLGGGQGGTEVHLRSFGIQAVAPRPLRWERL